MVALKDFLPISLTQSLNFAAINFIQVKEQAHFVLIQHFYWSGF